METDFQIYYCGFKEDINVFYRIFKELNVLFDQVNQIITSILLLQISLGNTWQTLRSVEPKL